IRRIDSPATAKASVGATSAGIITFPRTPSLKKMASAPSATKTAPTIPPISAWDELDGSPKYQVIRFQAIAATRPPNTASRPIEDGSTTSSATVAATWSEIKAPMKFRIAAYPTARLGAIARVETEVATTLAVSWKPFVKSKISATPTTIATVRRSPSTQEFLITMPSTMFATVSVASIASSRRSKNVASCLLEQVEELTVPRRYHLVKAHLAGP